MFEAPSAPNGGDECSDGSTCITLWGDRFPTCRNGTCVNECRWSEKPRFRWNKGHFPRPVGYLSSPHDTSGQPRVSRFSTLKEALNDCAAEFGCKGVSAFWSDAGKFVTFEAGSGVLEASASHTAYVKGSTCRVGDLPPISWFNVKATTPVVSDADAIKTILDQAIASNTFPFLTSIADIPTLSVSERNQIKTHIEGQLL